MKRDGDDPKTSLAAELDRTSWDYAPGSYRSFLLSPVGRIFGNLPWEVRAQHLSPVPFSEILETGKDLEAVFDTRPLPVLKKKG